MYYKVLAKLLVYKLGECVHISKSQFGSIPIGTVSEASSYLQTVINSAKRNGEPIQIVFLDGRVVFDLTRTAMMVLLGTPDEPMKKLSTLTIKVFFCVRKVWILLNGN